MKALPVMPIMEARSSRLCHKAEAAGRNQAVPSDEPVDRDSRDLSNPDRRA